MTYIRYFHWQTSSNSVGRVAKRMQSRRECAAVAEFEPPPLVLYVVILFPQRVVCSRNQPGGSSGGHKSVHFHTALKKCRQWRRRRRLEVPVHWFWWVKRRKSRVRLFNSGRQTWTRAPGTMEREREKKETSQYADLEKHVRKERVKQQSALNTLPKF